MKLDRRDFLKAAAAGLGATGLAGTNTAAAAGAPAARPGGRGPAGLPENWRDEIQP